MKSSGCDYRLTGYHVCECHKGRPDIPELEMQKWHSNHPYYVYWPWKTEASQDSAELLKGKKQVIYIQAKNGLGFAFLSFLLLSHDVKEAWPLPSGIFRRRDTWASVSSLQQHQICFGLHLWCVDLSQCVRRADRSAQASHWSVWGDEWKKDRRGRRSVWERCCPGDCVGLPGWQAVAAVFSLLDMEKKRWKLGGYQKKIEA